ncbi:MAG: T9SS type A sorting domain-containing protein [Ignavibacteriales bacterium]|nr:T9SS type A sorting domain-containing protein [Ignavibacteriales bacterium]
MKKLFKVFAFLFILFSAANLFAQTASVTWALNNTTQLTSVNVGNVTGSAESVSAGSGRFGMSVFDYSSNGQRLWEGTAGWISGTEEATRYTQFDALPVSGNSFTVTNVSFHYGAAGMDNNIQSNTYYSTDGWVTRTLLNPNPLAYPGSGMSPFTHNVSVTITSGTTFSVRIYPYAIVNSSPMGPTFAVHSNVVISGTTDSKKNCILQVTNVAGKWGKSVFLTARLQETGPTGNTNLPGRKVSMGTRESDTCDCPLGDIFNNTGTTDANGIVSIAYTIPQDSASSSLKALQDSVAHSIRAEFAGDAIYNSIIGFGKLTVVRHVASLTVSPTTTVYGQPVVFTATLIDNDNSGKGVSNQTLKFYKISPGTREGDTARVYIGSGTTNANGAASISYTLPQDSVISSISVSYAGDANYSPKSGTGTLKKMTSIQVTNATGKWGKSVLLTGSLQVLGTPQSSYLPNQELKFYQDSVYIASATTDKNGVASLMYTIPQDSVNGSIAAPQDSVTHSVTVSFAGDANYGMQSGTGKLIAVRHLTNISVAPLIAVFGQQVELVATLTDNDNNGNSISKQVLKFNIVEGIGDQAKAISIGSATTNTSGVASIAYTVPQDSISRSISVSFVGDANFSQQSGTGKLGYAVKSCVVQITDAAGKWGNSILLTARLQEIGLAGNTNLPNQVLRFYVNNKYVNSGITNSNGVANLMYTIPQDSVSSSIITPQDSVMRTISVTFAGDANYNTQSSSGKLTVAKHVTKVIVPETMVVFGQPVVFSAALTDNDNDGKGVPNQELKFYYVPQDSLNQKYIGSGATNASGVANLMYTLPQDSVASTHTIQAVYTGNSNYRAQSGSGKLTYKLTDVANKQVDIPEKYDLTQNYPNPFNPTSTIRYDIPKTGFVNISVYDILGREIKVLVNEVKNPGHFEIVFDARELASGIYFYTIKAGDFVQSKKMILMK